MKKRYLKVLSISLLLAGITFVNTGCGCNSNKVKVTFVSEGNSDIIRYVKKGKTLVDIPTPPTVKAKYCLWDREDFQNLNEDITVRAECFSSVAEMQTNIPDEKDVEISSDEADLDYIFKDTEIKVTFESGETKIVYPGEYKIESNGYNKDISGSYNVGVVYNNARKNIKINVNKIKDYVTVTLNSGKGYYNEGLPKLTANTDVEGEVSFDPNQVLEVNTKAYSWTFTPKDTNKYEVVKGLIDVNLINASSLNLNYYSMNVEFGVTKDEIIEMIKSDLVVKGSFEGVYREIDEEFYTIDTLEDFSSGKSGVFTFRVSYTQDVYKDILVTVNQCDTYSLNVNEYDLFGYEDHMKLEDLISNIRVSSGIDGVLSFEPNQSLLLGDYQYDYVFTPNDLHYAVKKGRVTIRVYKAESLNYIMKKEYDYGTSKDDILTQMRQSLVGTVRYGEDIDEIINKNILRIMIDDSGFNSHQPGTYQYKITYQGLELIDTFTINKVTLQKGIDFTINCQNVNPDNYQTMPMCIIKRQQTSNYEFDPKLFTLVPISASDESPLVYKYVAELIPDSSISSIFNKVIVEVEVAKNLSGGPIM